MYSGNNPNSGKDPPIFFYVAKGGAKVSSLPAEFQLPSAQNSPHTKVAYFEGTCAESLQTLNSLCVTVAHLGVACA